MLHTLNLAKYPNYFQQVLVKNLKQHDPPRRKEKKSMKLQIQARHNNKQVI